MFFKRSGLEDLKRVIKQISKNGNKLVRCWELVSLSEFASQTRYGCKKKSSANSSDIFCSRCMFDNQNACCF